MSQSRHEVPPSYPLADENFSIFFLLFSNFFKFFRIRYEESIGSRNYPGGFRTAEKLCVEWGEVKRGRRRSDWVGRGWAGARGQVRARITRVCRSACAQAHRHTPRSLQAHAAHMHMHQHTPASGHGSRCQHASQHATTCVLCT